MLKQKKIRTNKENGKTYIGSSVDLARRFSEYFRASALKKDSMAINKALPFLQKKIISIFLLYKKMERMDTQHLAGKSNFLKK